MDLRGNRLRLIALVAFAVLAAASVPAYRAFKGWRAGRLAQEALGALEAGDLETASEKARAAYHLRPADLEVVRATARVAGAASPARGVEFWEIAAILSGDAPDDLRGLAAAAIAAADLDAAAAALERLESRAYDDPGTMLLRADWLAAQGRHAEAADLSAQAMALRPDAPWEDLRRHALHLLRAGRRGELVAFLSGLGMADDAAGLNALRLMAQLPDLDAGQLGPLARRLDAHPLAERQDRLAALLMMRAAGTLDDTALADRATALFKLEDDGELLEFAGWLLRNGLPGAVSAHLDEARALTRRDLFLVWADSLAMQGGWERLSAVLDQPRLPLEDALRHLFRMRAFMELGKVAQADLAWNNATNSAARSPAQLGILAEYALKMGLHERARDALWRLTTDPAVARGAFEQLVLLEERSGRTVELWEVLGTMEAAFPADPAVASDLAYIDALLDRDVAGAVASARELVERYPRHLPYRVSLAAALMRSGSPAEALAVLQPLEVDWLAQRPRWRVVVAWVASGNDAPAQARAALEGVDLTALLPEERALAEEIAAGLR